MSQLSGDEVRPTIQEVADDVKVYASLGFILEKLERDSIFPKLTKLFGDIFQQEIDFTIKGSLIRAS